MLQTLVQVNLSAEVVRDVKHLAIEWGVFKNEAYERLLREALKPYKVLR